MPPSLPGGPLSSIRQCRAPSTTTTRAFTASTPVYVRSKFQQVGGIRPDRPEFSWNLPQSRQTEPPRKPVIKGTLPSPRKIFHRRLKDKATPEFGLRATPEPTRERPAPDDFTAWKRRMAEQRRTSLREGLAELVERKDAAQSQAMGISKARRIDRVERLNRPQREDERLTNPTIMASNQLLERGPLTDPNRAVRLARMAANVHAKEGARKEARRIALHTLYMNARSFITTEEQLNDEVEKIFTDEPFHVNDQEDNPWIALGSPLSVAEMLKQSRGEALRQRPESVLTQATIMGRRVKKIAEELTGGKMD